MGNAGRLATVALRLALVLTLAGITPVPVWGVIRPGSAVTATGVLRSTPRGGVDSAGQGRRVPVVLIHGLTGTGPSVWGARADGGRGLYGRLFEAGYEPGRTLFAFDYEGAEGADYATLAETGLDRVVRQALAASGAARVDLLTFGTGALVARYWVAGHSGADAAGPAGAGAGGRADGRAPLRNLVMVAPPNHGQFQADLLKVLYHTDRLLRETRPSRARGAAQSVNPFPEPPAFSSEDQYVAARARDYQRLYADYALECRLLAGATSGPGAGVTGRLSPPPGYDAWLLSERAGLVDEFIYGAQRQPEAPALGLTLAYYEMLSLRVGRQLYLAGAVAGGKAPPLPELEDLLSEQWRSRILGYLKGLLLEWGLPKAARLWAEHRSGLGLALGEMLTCLAPDGAPMSRLIPEYLSFPWPGATPCRVEPPARLILCNAFLSEWERREATGRPAGSRYVTIAGDCPSPLGLTGVEVGPNDLTVEAASALIEPQGPDAFRLRKGLMWAHGLLPGNPRLAADVLAILAGAASSVAPAAGAGTGSATLWEPAYAPLDAGPGEAPVKVEVRVGDPAAGGLHGLVALAWLANVPATSPPEAGGEVPTGLAFAEFGADPQSRAGVTLVTTLTAPSPTPDQRLLLGVRLVPLAPAGQGFLTMGRYLGRRPCVPFSYSVSRDALAGEAAPPAGTELVAGGDTGGLGDGAPPGQVAGPVEQPGGEPESGAGSPASSGDDLDAGGRAEIVPTPKPPLINVVRVTKLTTDKREDRTFHATWEWDFGDGERLSDVDPSHTKVTVTHTYSTGGSYRVSATSLANDGRVLRKLEWTVNAGRTEGTGGTPAPGGGTPAGETPQGNGDGNGDGLTFSFEAETIVEPVVVLTLEGPEKWITGQPARFGLKADVSWPPRTRRQVIRAYPGWFFDVVWEKPGRFEVRAAVTVRQSYEFPDQRITVYNTYVTVVSVEVLTPGLTE